MRSCITQAEELALRQATIVVVGRPSLKDELIASRHRCGPGGRSGAARRAGCGAWSRLPMRNAAARRRPAYTTGDAYKDQVQNQWNHNPVGSHHARESSPTRSSGFSKWSGIATASTRRGCPRRWSSRSTPARTCSKSAAAWAPISRSSRKHGARVTDVDLAAGHLQLAQENFRLRGLTGRFIHHDAETLPFDDASFDVVYSNGVLHHTPNTRRWCAKSTGCSGRAAGRS